MQGLAVEMIADLELGGFTARVPDIPAYGEGDSEEAALADLQEALRTYVEAFGLEDTLARVNRPVALRDFDNGRHKAAPAVLPPVLCGKLGKNRRQDRRRYLVVRATTESTYLGTAPCTNFTRSA